MDDTERPLLKDDKGRFVSGNSGGGRPKGSRNKLGEAFILALHDDFHEHGKAAIEKVRAEKPDAYLKVIASILPAQLQVNVTHDLSDSELDERIRQLASALSLEVRADRVIGGEGPETQH